MTARGLYRFRLRFEARALDQFQEPTGAFEPVFRCFGRVVFLRGGEQVQAGRLNGVSTANIVVDAFAASRAVTNAWRVVDENAGTAFDIKDVQLSEDRQNVLILAESGSADGGETTEAQP